MAKPFAKLFDTECGQFLVTVDTADTDTFGPCICFRGAEVDGVVPAITLGPWPDNDAGWAHVEKVLANFDQAEAERNASSLKSAVRGMLDDAETAA